MDKFELCLSGTEIRTKEECRSAMQYALTMGITLRSRKFVHGNWGWVPFGCSYQAGGGQAFHFNKLSTTFTRGKGPLGSGFYRMICKKGNTI